MPGAKNQTEELLDKRRLSMFRSSEHHEIGAQISWTLGATVSVLAHLFFLSVFLCSMLLPSPVITSPSAATSPESSSSPSVTPETVMAMIDEGLQMDESLWQEIIHVQLPRMDDVEWSEWRPVLIRLITTHDDFRIRPLSPASSRDAAHTVRVDAIHAVLNRARRSDSSLLTALATSPEIQWGYRQMIADFLVNEWNMEQLDIFINDPHGRENPPFPLPSPQLPRGEVEMLVSQVLNTGATPTARENAFRRLSAFHSRGLVDVAVALLNDSSAPDSLIRLSQRYLVDNGSSSNVPEVLNYLQTHQRVEHVRHWPDCLRFLALHGDIHVRPVLESFCGNPFVSQEAEVFLREFDERVGNQQVIDQEY